MSRFGTPEAIIGGQLPPLSTAPTPTPSPALGALGLSTTSFTAGIAAVVAIIGATTGSAITGTPPDGMTLNSGARTITGTPMTAGSYQVVLTETLAGATGSPRQTTVGVTVAAAPLAGFSPNGATNTALKSMLAGVKAGSRRGKMLVASDSVGSTGQGASTDASPGTYGLVNARKNRPAAVLAALYTASGVPALDNSFVGDNGVSLAGGTLLSTYDPRISLGTDSASQAAWTPYGGGTFAGGSYLLGGFESKYSDLLTFTPEGQTDTYEVLLYNSVLLTPGSTSDDYKLYVDIDGTPAATGVNPIPQDGTGGFTRATFTAATIAAHTFRVLAGSHNNAHHPALCSITAYNSAVAAIDIKVPGSCGAQSGDLAASSASSAGQRWSRMEYYASEAPDVIVLNDGYNDSNGSVSAAARTANNQAIIEAQKARGGTVLLVTPSMAGGNYGTMLQAYHDADKALAASEGIAHLSLFEHYGPTFTGAMQARTFDGQVHQRAEYAAEQAGLVKQALDLMAA